jgi:hypothetical protein
MNKSINSISFEGNPLGSIGIKYIMKAKNENESQDFLINLKGADNEFDLEQQKPSLSLFDVNDPEGKYCLKVET